jgi:Glycosyl transferase family 2
MVGSCPKCSATCISICQGGTRCGNCGHQETGVEQYYLKQHFQTETYQPHQPQYQLHPQGYRTYPQPSIYRKVLHECEDVESLQAALTKKYVSHQTPQVSIIMPTFKRQHTINLTVGSILNQTFTAWELIIIDNELGNTYKFDDSRIRYYNHPEKLGASYGRNIGIQYVSTNLVCFFDDDDIMTNDYLERMVDPFLHDEKVNMVVCRVRLVENRITGYREFCTPTVVIKRKFADPSWINQSNHDIQYFSNIANSIPANSLVELDHVLVHAYSSGSGGIRDGAM